MRMILCFAVTCLWVSTMSINAQQPEPVQQPTDYAALDRFIHEYTDEVEGGNGRWAFVIEGVSVMVMADQAADRMRIMTPVASVADFEDGEYERLMEANYDRALDARYAINAGVLWSAFIHPMSSLTHEQFDDGLNQAVRLSTNFGTTYTSSDMVFAPNEQQPQDQPRQDEQPHQHDEPAPPNRGAPPAPRS